jgi:hypothetical protein
MFLQKLCKAPFVVVQTKTRQQDGNPSRLLQKVQALFPQVLRDAADQMKMAQEMIFIPAKLLLGGDADKDGHYTF